VLVNRELDQRCIELALADLRCLQPQQRRRALAQLQSIDSELAERLNLELLFHSA
jgi:phage-related protein